MLKNKQDWKNFYSHRLRNKWQIYDRLITIWYLPDCCLTTVKRLPEDCLMTAWRLPEDCLKTAWRLPEDCLKTAWRLLGPGCRKFIKRAGAGCKNVKLHTKKIVQCIKMITMLIFHQIWPNIPGWNWLTLVELTPKFVRFFFVLILYFPCLSDPFQQAK